MARLTVNLDEIALMRTFGKVSSPDPAAAAILCEFGGADGIEVHIREDRRHTQDRDAMILRQVVQTKLVLKIASTPEMVGIALNIKPDYVTLVPEKREEFTAEGGLDLIAHQNAISETIEMLQNSGIPVCLLVDPEPDQIRLAHQMNAPIVEIHIRSFCDAATSMRKNQMFSKIVDAIKLAYRLKMVVTVGQGLEYATIKAFKGYPEIQEFVIGHSIVARALMVGMEKAVKEMVNRIRELQLGLHSV